MRALRAAGDLPVEPKQAWTPVAEFGLRRRRRRELRPRRPRPGAHGATSTCASTRSSRSYRAAGAAARAAEPRPRGAGHLPVRAPDRGGGAGRVRAGRDVIDFGVGEPREETPAFIRRALAEAVEAEPVSTYPAVGGAARAARGDRRLVRAALRRERSTRRPRSCRRSAPRRRSSTSPRSSAARGDRVAVTTPGYPVPARGAAFAGAEVVELPLRPGARLAARPRRGRLVRRRAAVAELPRQPDRGDRARRSCWSARRRSRAATASSLACDEAYSELWFAGEPPLSGAAARRPRAASSCSTRCPSAPRCPATARASWPATRRVIAALKRYRPERRHRAADLRPAGGDRRLGRRGPRARDPRALRAPSATRCCPRCWPPGWSRPAATRASSCGCAVERRRRGLRAARCCDERGIVVAPGPFFGPGGEGHVRVALVPTLEACREAARRLGSRA